MPMETVVQLQDKWSLMKEVAQDRFYCTLQDKTCKGGIAGELIVPCPHLGYVRGSSWKRYFAVISSLRMEIWPVKHVEHA